MLVGLVSKLFDFWSYFDLFFGFRWLREACGGKILRTEGRRRTYGRGFAEELLFWG